MAGIRLEGIVKRFGKTIALRGVDLDIKDGESLVLLGPSGCGKTTTLRIIAGLEKPDGGRVFFDDRDVTGLPPRKRNVSMVFQSYALWPHMKVFDNIAFPLKIRRVDKDEIRRRVKWAAELLGIDDLLDRYPHQLSGGQRQRVAVARAIVVEPEVLLMDEPLSNLDAILRVRMRSEIKKLQRRIGVTMVYVTHDQVEAMVIGDRIAVMNDGMVMQVGSPGEIYNRPANTFVATFIGSPQINLLEAEVTSSGRRSLLRIKGVGSIDLEGFTGSGKVIVGVRPERIVLGSEGDGIVVSGSIDFIENLGSDYIIHVRVAGDKIITVKTSEPPSNGVGDPIKLTLPSEHVIIFDAKTGKALTHGI